MTETAGSRAAPARGPALSRLSLHSLLGLLVFFVPIELAGRSTTPRRRSSPMPGPWR